MSRIHQASNSLSRNRGRPYNKTTLKCTQDALNLSTLKLDHHKTQVNQTRNSDQTISTPERLTNCCYNSINIVCLNLNRFF